MSSRRAWLWTVLLAVPGLLLLTLPMVHGRFRLHHAMSMLVSAPWHLPLLVLAMLGLLLLFRGLLLLFTRKEPRPGVAARLAPWLLGLGFIGIAGYAAYAHQIHAPWMEDQINQELLAGLQAAELRAPSSTTATTGWPQWRGPARDGHSPERGLLLDWSSPPKVAWRAPIKGGFASMAIVDGCVYVMDREYHNERVLCYDANDGKQLWVHSYRVDYSVLDRRYQDGPKATPTVHDGRVYVVGATGLFLCLEAKPAGNVPKVLWQKDLMTDYAATPPTWGVSCSPLVDGNLVIVQPGGEKGSVVAFDRVTGNQVWTCRSDRSGYSSPVVASLAGVKQVVAATAMGLVGIDPTDGREPWFSRWVTNFDANIATPVVAGNYVFMSSAYDKGCTLLEIRPDGKGLSAETVYAKNNKLMRTHHVTCILQDDYLYGVDSGANVLKCINLRTAEEVWTTRSLKKGCCILADGHLIYLSEEGELAVVEATPQEFRLKGKFQVFPEDTQQTWALPALADGKLFVRNDKELVCIQLK